MQPHCHSSPPIEMAQGFSLRQLYAFAQWQRHARRQRDLLTDLQRQFAHVLGFSPRREGAVALLGPLTLIVADDQPLVRVITRDVLEGYGHRVILADGSFRNVPERARIDAVLLDVPMLTEFQTARVRKARRYSRRIVVCTPLPEGSARARLRQAGAVAFVSKPFQPLELALLLQEVLSM